jgi:glycosyltransferase involved in cell wall biosynthesis
VRVLYYTHPAFFEPALCLVRELSDDADVHLVLEVSPGAWQTAGFDLAERRLPAGLVPGDEVLRDAFPAGVRSYWQSAASFHLAVHHTRRSLHPASWTISRRVLAYAADIGCDVLHVDDVDVSPRLALALPGAHTPPLVISVHDPEPHSGERNWRKRLGRAFAYRRARQFVLFNNAQRESFARRLHIPSAAVHVARLGSYAICREWVADTAPRKPTVLFFGRLSPYKGLDVFYDAARLVSQRVPGARFLVAGQRLAGYTVPERPDLSASGSEIEIVERYLSNAETANHFRSATVVVCPYRDATQSGVILTALAFGVPVVASNAGGLAEYVVSGKTGIVVPAGDVQATADAICRVLNDADYRASLAEGIASARDELSWRSTAESVRRVYESATLHTQVQSVLRNVGSPAGPGVAGSECRNS